MGHSRHVVLGRLVGHSRQKAWQARRLWPDGHTTEMAKPQVFALAKDVKEAESQSTFFNCSSHSLRLTYRGNSR